MDDQLSSETLASSCEEQSGDWNRSRVSNISTPRSLEWVKVAGFIESLRNGFVFSSWCCIIARVSREAAIYSEASERSVA